MSIPIPENYSHRPPDPNIVEVYFQEEPKHIYYASMYKKQLDADTVAEEIYSTMEVMDKRGEIYEWGYYSLAIYDVNIKQVNKCKYYEYWLYGEKMEKDYKTSRSTDDEDEEEINNNNNSSNNKNNNKGKIMNNDICRGKNKYSEGSSSSSSKISNKNSKNDTPFVQTMITKNMIKMEL